jgi:hypothetical protein
MTQLLLDEVQNEELGRAELSKPLQPIPPGEERPTCRAAFLDEPRGNPRYNMERDIHADGG